MRASRGITLVEALLALGVTFMLIAVLYTLLVSSRRGMVRGEGKLEYIGEANRLFQSMKMDAAALTKPPAWSATAKELKLDILRVERAPVYRTIPARVSYKLEGQTIHRRVEGAGDPNIEHRLFGLDKLKDFKITAGKLRSAENITVEIVFKLENEPVPTEFTKVLFLKNLRLDKTWNPLPEM